MSVHPFDATVSKRGVDSSRRQEVSDEETHNFAADANVDAAVATAKKAETDAAEETVTDAAVAEEVMDGTTAAKKKGDVNTDVQCGRFGERG